MYIAMKSIKRLLPLFLLTCFILGACKEEEDTRALLPDMQEILAFNTRISDTLDILLVSDEPLVGFNNVIDYIKAEALVADVYVSGHVCYVEYVDGSMASWCVTPEMTVPPFIDISNKTDEGAELTFISREVGNKKVALIDAQSEDERRIERHTQIFDVLSEKFEERGFEVEVKKGEEADVEFFGENLDEYGTIFYFSHGSFDPKHSLTWVNTGERYRDGRLIGLYRDKWREWFRSKKIQIMTTEEMINGELKTVKYWAISNEFIETHYEVGSFPNSIIYAVACQGLTSPEKEMAKAFTEAGAGVVIGWNETNSQGQAVGKLLFEYLLGGETVGTAFDLLPDEAKREEEDGLIAELVYYPNSQEAADMSLLEVVDPNSDMKIILNSPTDGTTLNNRVQVLSGSVVNVAALESGIVEINGISVRLEVSGTTFSQPILLQSGQNDIRLVCYVRDNNDAPKVVAQTLSVTGNFPPQDLITQLRWNTDYSDVDLHLLPPGASLDDLWTSVDCYYGNPSTAWGAMLDVDDTEGYGPEHITIDQVSQPGEYRLIAHFYHEDNAGPTDAYVTVSSPGSTKNFGPYRLIEGGGLNNQGLYAGGDAYEVCWISFPSGEIIDINKKIDWPGKRQLSLPGK